MELNNFLQSRLRFTEKEIEKIITVFDSKSISSVQELADLPDDSWNTLYQHFPSKSVKIRDEIGKSVQTNSFLSSDKNKKRTPGEILGDWHKTVRFLYYDAEMFLKLKETPLLSKDALDLGLKEQKNGSSFNGGPILSQIEEAFKTFTIKSNENATPSHGMLMYGPPGTW